MKNGLLLIAFLILLAPNLTAQTASTAPVVWERYRVPASKLSVFFPKLPVKVENIDYCEENKTASYYAFAEGAIYELQVTSKKSSSWRPPGCANAAKFGSATLASRLSEIRGGPNQPVEEASVVDGRETYKFTTKHAVRWVFSDLEKGKRIVELSITHYPDATPDFDRFVGSLDFAGAGGKEIGDGSPVTLGDANDTRATAAVAPPSQNNTVTGVGSGTGAKSGQASGSTLKTGDATGTAAAVVTDPLQIVAKPRASYTDAARDADINGTVRLKVTMLSNGAIGSVTPVTALPYGLTEQAIAAARRIVFLPGRIKNVPVSKIITIDYSFTIY